ncbi:uncharacterized protein LOC119789328 isoform X2 [Cyprinodon tularosa]|uniref:uncharacterized protein LOC119789328 isoform X2 n=1 Tax=Cyprinodon tularosa TaxID=77115 RepID=UPI0018E27BEF|nr:uncharacterized protein LOC119789328 isoform X2 [Cyprinodon tularosa]
MQLNTLLLLFFTVSGFSKALKAEVDGIRIDVSDKERENGGENLEENEQEQMMDRFTSLTKKTSENKPTTEERRNEKGPRFKGESERISVQKNQNQISLFSNIDDFLEENQQYIRRFEEASMSNTDSGMNLVPESNINRLGCSRGLKMIRNCTNKQEKQVVKTSATIKKNNPLIEKDRKLDAVIPLFDKRRDTKDDKNTKRIASDLKLRKVEEKDPLILEAKTITAKQSVDINKVHEAKKEEFITTLQAVKPNPADLRLVGKLKYLKTIEEKKTEEINENIRTGKTVYFTPRPSITLTLGEPRAVTQMRKDNTFTDKYNKTSPTEPQGTKPSIKLKLLPTTVTSMTPTTTIKSSRNKKKSKKKKRRKENKTPTPQETMKKIPPAVYFPYFMDDYCPPECACYGRVVQCSDKGVEQFPYGIPYKTRNILLMNNNISSIQLDLLRDYSSMELISLSNNRLTDGAIEGSFEEIPSLKRLYLDRNFLQSVPTDLPDSLEELRLDSNNLMMMSEAVWTQCPRLLVLSLSNNSLGNGFKSLPPGAFSPLRNLRTLNLNYNQLASVPLELPLSIKELYLRGNHIKQFSRGVFKGISELLVLDLSVNKLKSKGLLWDSFFNASHLESLNLEANQLKQMPQNLPYSLKTLNLEGNLISSIKKTSFSKLINLEHLGIARNKIFKISSGAFKTLSVLHQLDLCHNMLRQVPRQLPGGLHSVALTHNKIESVPHDAFCWGNQSHSRLVQVQLEYNFIDLGKLDEKAFRCLRGMQVLHFY